MQWTPDLLIVGSNSGLAIFFLFFPPKMRKKWVLAYPNFSECTARVKLELTDFSSEAYIELNFSQMKISSELGIY